MNPPSTKKVVKMYLVGYKGARQDALYSHGAWVNSDESGGVYKMTLHQAKKELKRLHGTNRTPAAIFKCIPISLPKSK